MHCKNEKRKLVLKKLAVLLITVIVLIVTAGCYMPEMSVDDSDGSATTNEKSDAFINKEYGKDTFYILYNRNSSDLVINEDTEKWGFLKCGECTYYEFDSYSANSTTEKHLFHNVMIIRTSDKAMSWFIYNDKDFSTYRMKDNFGIDEHSEKHNSNNLYKGIDVDSWHLLNWAFYSLDENIDIGTDRGIGIKTNEDYDSITFCAVTENETWDICTVDISNCENQEMDGEMFYVFTGEMRGEYEDGKYVAGGIEVSDRILFMFNESRNVLTVISLLELQSGDTDYPIMCSGTYFLEE